MSYQTKCSRDCVSSIHLHVACEHRALVSSLLCCFLAESLWILISSSLYMNVHLSTPVWHGWLSFLGNGIRVSIYKGFLNLKPGMFYHWKLSVLWSNTACTRSQIVHLKAIKGKLEISLIFPRCFKWSIFSCLFSFFLFNRIILLIHFVSRRHRLSSIAVKPKLDM